VRWLPHRGHRTRRMPTISHSRPRSAMSAARSMGYGEGRFRGPSSRRYLKGAMEAGSEQAEAAIGELAAGCRSAPAMDVSVSDALAPIL
jgi:hypothetical protein